MRVGITVVFLSAGLLIPAHTLPAQLTDCEPIWASQAPPATFSLSSKSVREAEAFAFILCGLLIQEEQGPANALPWFLHALAKNPSLTSLAIETAQELLRGGDIPGALSLLEDAAKANPASPAPDSLIAEILLTQLNRPAQAAIHARRAVAKSPDDFAPWRLLWHILRHQQRTEEAAALLLQASTNHSAPAAFHLDLASHLLTNPGALPPEQAHPLIHSALTKASDSLPADAAPTLISRTADLWAVAGHPENAATLYERAIASTSGPALPTLLEKAAEARIAEGQPRLALPYLEKLTKIAPDSPNSWQQLARAALLSGEQSTTEKALTKIAELRPSDPASNHQLIAWHLSQKQWNAAAQAADKALQHHPRDGLLHCLRARALLRLDEFQNALDAFASALKWAPIGRPDYLGGEFYYEYGTAAAEAGDHQLAADLLQKAASIDPSLAPRAANHIGYMWTERGENLDQAEILILQALQAEPSNPAYLDSLGWVRYRQGRHSDALSLLLRAHSLSPEPEPVILDHIGDVWAALGRPAQAILYWQKALALDPAQASILLKIENLKASTTEGL